jgi:hypothetical protein
MGDGHCGLPVKELMALAEKLLEVPEALIGTALELELAEGTVTADSVGDLRDAITKYEAVAMALLETSGKDIGGLLDSFPPKESALRVERFFDTIYRRYDERFVFAAPVFATRNVTPRVEWDEKSPVFDKGLLAAHEEVPELDYGPRIG